MTNPYYWCLNCGSTQTINMNGQGFPPETAKKKLEKSCAAKDCKCDPRYRAGFG